MAPDLNSVPASPRALAASPRVMATPQSRRASQQMGPPPLPLSSPALNILPSNQSTVNNPTQHSTSPGLPNSINMASPPPGDNTGVGPGPGPLRHPRPLTAADLHLQLEKEQEAVVNRLTRELSMLRAAQNASVVSNSSSTSAGFPDTADVNANHMMSGPSHPAPSQRRHHRSDSSTSQRSITSGTTVGWPIGGSMASVVGSDGRTRSTAPRHDSIPQAISLSRQNSITSSRRSGASSPAIPSVSSSYQHPDYFQRPSLPQYREPSGTATGPASSTAATFGDSSERHLSTSSMTSVQTTGRYEEAAFHRHELEAVKRENETLKRRIRELERTLRERRQSDASRTRSESVSTTASALEASVAGGTGVGRGRDREKDDSEEIVRVGESARSSGALLR